MIGAEWICAIAVAALLFGEWRGDRKLVWIAKPLASAAFVIAAIDSVHRAPSRYGSTLLVAFLLSWLGDVLLIPQSKRVFLAGIGAFLLAHVAFIVAFVGLRADRSTLVIAFLALSLFGIVVMRALAQRLRGGLRFAVAAYIATIVIMASCAIGTLRPLIIAGAVAFFVSDLFVARQRFVQKSFVNKAIGLPLYYVAQFLLVATLA